MIVKRIRDIAYALKVCKKYNLIWNPYVKLGYGGYDWDSRSVHVNLFSKDFITIFMHEVGHHVHHCKVNLPVWLRYQGNELRFSGGNMEDWSIYRNLQAEAIASRFARKSGKADKNYLIRAFHTYTASIFKHTNKSIVVKEISCIIGSCYKNERMISK
jgi:hypothetical protein